MADSPETDLIRRQWLVKATAAAGGIGLVAAAVPFIQSMSPSEAARAAGAPVEVDIDKLAPGALVTATWAPVGPVASIAPATGPGSTWRAGYSRMFRRRAISKFHRTST